MGCSRSSKLSLSTEHRIYSRNSSLFRYVELWYTFKNIHLIFWKVNIHCNIILRCSRSSKLSWNLEPWIYKCNWSLFGYEKLQYVFNHVNWIFWQINIHYKTILECSRSSKLSWSSYYRIYSRNSSIVYYIELQKAFLQY